MGSAAVSTRLDLLRGRIREWMEGSRPDCLHGLLLAEEHGWMNIDISAESDRLRGLNVLAAWVFSGGSLARDWYTPYWVVNDDRDCELLDAATELSHVQLDYTRDAMERRAREVRPVGHATVLGRVLMVLGAPVGGKNETSDVSLPRYLYSVPERIQREFIQVYLHNRAQSRPDTDMLRFRENRPRSYLTSLAQLIERLTNESVSVSEMNVIISAAAAREIGTWPSLLS